MYTKKPYKIHKIGPESMTMCVLENTKVSRLLIELIRRSLPKNLSIILRGRGPKNARTSLTSAPRICVCLAFDKTTLNHEKAEDVLDRLLYFRSATLEDRFLEHRQANRDRVQTYVMR